MRHYNKEKFNQEFLQSETYKKLTIDYQHVYESISEYNDGFEPIPRRTYAANQSIFYYGTFYYINMLLEKQPKTILDLGCGGNFFKKYVPEIIGVDPDPREADRIDILDAYSEKFLNENLQKYDCAMTIGAIHTVSLVKLVDTIHDFGKLIKPGGRGYFAVNLRRPFQYTELHDFAKLFDLSRRQTLIDLYRVIHNLSSQINYKLIAFDITFLDAEKERYNLIKGTDWPSWDDYVLGKVTNLNKNLHEEIEKFGFGQQPFTINGPVEIVDGNLKIVFDV